MRQLYKGQHSKRVTLYVLVTKIVQDKIDITLSKLRLQGWPQEKALVHDWKL